MNCGRVVLDPAPGEKPSPTPFVVNWCDERSRLGGGAAVGPRETSCDAASMRGTKEVSSDLGKIVKLIEMSNLGGSTK